MGFLDNEGLAHFWGKVKDALSGKQDTITAGDGVSQAGSTISVTTPVRGVVTQAEFDALPEERRNKGLYVIPGGSGTSGGGSPWEVYSTEEQRIGTWVDGKPLYRITIPVHVTNHTTSPNLGTVGKSIKHTYGKVVEDNHGYVFPIPYAQSDSNGKAINSIGVGGIENEETYVFLFSPNEVNATGYVTLEYTKATDEGGAL